MVSACAACDSADTSCVHTFYTAWLLTSIAAGTESTCTYESPVDSHTRNTAALARMVNARSTTDSGCEHITTVTCLKGAGIVLPADTEWI